MIDEMVVVGVDVHSLVVVVVFIVGEQYYISILKINLII